MLALGAGSYEDNTLYHSIHNPNLLLSDYGFIHLKIVSNEGLCLRGCSMKILLEHVKLVARSQPKVGDEQPAEIHDSVVEVENRRLSMM